MIFIPVKREKHDEGDYVFYRASLPNERVVTVRQYGNRIGCAEVFNSPNTVGENVVARFDVKDRTFNEVMTAIANYFNETVHILPDNESGIYNYVSSHYPTK